MGFCCTKERKDADNSSVLPTQLSRSPDEQFYINARGLHSSIERVNVFDSQAK